MTSKMIAFITIAILILGAVTFWQFNKENNTSYSEEECQEVVAGTGSGLNASQARCFGQIR